MCDARVLPPSNSSPATYIDTPEWGFVQTALEQQQKNAPTDLPLRMYSLCVMQEKKVGYRTDNPTQSFSGRETLIDVCTSGRVGRGGTRRRSSQHLARGVKTSLLRISNFQDASQVRVSQNADTSFSCTCAMRVMCGRLNLSSFSVGHYADHLQTFCVWMRLLCVSMQSTMV